MELFMYGTAVNTGKGFFTHEDRQDFYLAGHPGIYKWLATTPSED